MSTSPVNAVRDLVVDTGPVPIAVRDFGGAGRSLLLLHGAGGNLAVWTSFARLLTPDFRVVAPDLRGHGRSGSGPWTWADVLADLEAVVEHLGLADPVVVGHSLGGCLAAWWGRTHPDCPAVVDLDGHRGAETSPDNYPGLDPGQVTRDLAALSQVFTDQAAAMAEPLAPKQVAAMRERLVGAMTATGLPPEQANELFDRGLVVREGRTFLRPEAETVQEIRPLLRDGDLLDTLHEVRSPTLLCVATKDLPAAQAFGDLMAAYRRGLDRDLDLLEAAHPAVTVRRLDTSHAMPLEQPALVAGLVRDFVAAHL
ncbi:alpha/beta fold hydrolase [Actinopolymorpha singaporensis]|uniref:Pimeloyl-ACP methyl ester carboxylesterase n=1 Tax=Actinopolymorpha singaporensis TaxID=117157 RepID=A0A1H1MZH1_9ACTN|nr:alpha/beta hydrolase [Actinopolymorpha singaporensis]SDR92164.1 Pimeloyl-ACP methyl ester carboxylesterase [Actinopolymorpha singaporensis]